MNAVSCGPSGSAPGGRNRRQGTERRPSSTDRCELVRFLRFDAEGNLTFEAGPHESFDGDVAAIQQLCAALS